MSRFLISDAPQGTDAWLQARAGKATGSRAKDMLAKIKSGEAAARRDYRIELVTERLTGRPAQRGFISPEMTWGTEQEPFARLEYEEITGHTVREAGFVYLPDLAAGCSVDGFVEDADDGAAGILEIKCPKSATHLGYVLDEPALPSEHRAQVTHNLWVTSAAFCDFVSFDPRLPEALQFFLFRVMRDELVIAAHEAEVRAFMAEVDAFTLKLENFLRKAA